MNLHSNGNTSFYGNLMEISKFYYNSLPLFDLNNLDKNKITSYIDIMKQNYIAHWRHKVKHSKKLEVYNTFKHLSLKLFETNKKNN